MAAKQLHIRYGKAHVSLTVDPDQVVALDLLVYQRRSSRAALMREALDLYLRVNSHVGTSHSRLPEPEAA